MVQQIQNAAGTLPGYPVFVQDGVMTEAGRQLVEFVEAQFLPFDKLGTDANLSALNSLSGPFAEYYAIVHKLAQKTPAQWLKDFPQSAKNAHDIQKYVEAKVAAETAQEQQVQENTDKQTELEAKFAKLEETLGAKVAELETELERVRTENEALKSKPVTAKKAAAKKVVDAEPETETPAADVEAKPEGDTPAEGE